MRFSGKYGEHLVLTELLSRDIEAYLAHKVNQDSYDITAVLSETDVRRVQVKTTGLQNAATNNNIGSLDRTYDFLVIVVLDPPRPPRCFVLTLDEALAIKGSSKQLGVSRRRNLTFEVKPELAQYEARWDKIHTPR